MVEGLSHITFLVADLGRAAKLLRDVFDACLLYTSDAADE